MHSRSGSLASWLVAWVSGAVLGPWAFGEQRRLSLRGADSPEAVGSGLFECLTETGIENSQPGSEKHPLSLSKGSPGLFPSMFSSQGFEKNQSHLAHPRIGQGRKDRGSPPQICAAGGIRASWCAVDGALQLRAWSTCPAATPQAVCGTAARRTALSTDHACPV